MNYFSMGNKLFGFGLSPAEALVFCAVRSFRNPLFFAVCNAERISSKTGLSIRTVYRALESLQNKGLLGKVKRPTAMADIGHPTATMWRMWAVDSSR